MCGILGAVSIKGSFEKMPFSAKDLDRMTHRGPDGQGWFVGENVLMGFRRLAIIDLVGGAQPLFSEDEQVVMTINGEIYNYRTLREGLSSRHVFRTRTDGEVLLHLYEEHGPTFLSEVNGMFAFALYDRRNRRLLLGRDRAGKKPLYYEIRDGQLRWASELRALLGERRPSISRPGVAEYLRFGYVPAPRTMLEGVYKLPAASLLAVDRDGRLHEQPYWHIQYRRDDRAEPREGEIDDWSTGLLSALDRAVSLRLESEVPMGFLLSGGIDSASVVASGALALKEKRPYAFTIGFTGEAIDESQAAAEVAVRYKAHHSILSLRQDKAPMLSDILLKVEEPVSTDALLPTNEVFCGISNSHITTVLSGEGSDELFAGYRKFRQAAPWNPESPVPGASAIERYLSHEEFVFHDTAERRSLLWGEECDDGRFRNLDCEAAELDPLSQMLLIENRLRLPDRINLRLDRLSMAYSIEARAPFMDHILMEFCASIPNCLKMSPDTDKWILRYAMKERLPDSVLKARKAPFHAPDCWHTDSGDIDEILGVEAVAEAGLVNPESVQLIRQQAASRENRDAQERLFSLYVLHTWFRSFYCSLGSRGPAIR